MLLTTSILSPKNIPRTYHADLGYYSWSDLTLKSVMDVNSPHNPFNQPDKVR